MTAMNRSIAMLCVCVVFAGLGGVAQAQIPPGAAVLSPPPPPAPPPPKIEVPVVPQLDAAPSRPTAPVARRSFHDRVVDCLDEGAAAGLGPNQRAAYSRACANR
ncbi:hypothetical protein [Rhodopseudomonas palustris]|uniref:Uncharacterized protein n=1 Tax=Rhodopseudomonas palustris (strain BisB18) TaxID=316056 RepID=Q211J4_RHOPB